VKNIEWDIKFEPRKWNIHFHIFRFRNLKDLKNAKLDVFLFLTVGYGEILNIFRKGIILKLLSDEKPDINQQKDIKSDIIENKKSLVRFLHAVPKFVGVDMNVYGPYDNHDIANLPSNIAEVLISKERAEVIAVGK